MIITLARGETYIMIIAEDVMTYTARRGMWVCERSTGVVFSLLCDSSDQQFLCACVSVGNTHP